MPLPLLQTKLYVPPPHATLVNRPRLLARWQAALLPPLTLISAPAGFGKTTLISEWIGAVGQAAAVQTNDQPTASRQLTFCWLSLDQEDNDPIRFLTYLIGALQSCQPTIGEGALGLLAAPQPPPLQAVLTQLINELSQLPATICLVLDDYHFINTPAIHEALNFLIDHLPATLRVIMTTRSDPPLHLSRWRVRRQLLELHADDLRFTAAEAAIFLNQLMGLQLSPAAVELLESRTEGWIAGLQLAALSMQGRGDLTGFLASFSGSHRFIFDYLVDEVLAGQPAGIETFLLQTSILERFCAPLCDAVTAQADSRAILGQLERANLFLIPLDQERQWYRYHHLFADVLRARLLDQMADSMPALHRRAGQWFEANGLLAEAVNHCLAGQDYVKAGRLIEPLGEDLLKRGESASLQGWLDRLPIAVLYAQPRLCLQRAKLHTILHQLDAAESLLGAATESVRREPANPQATVTLSEVTAMYANIALNRNQLSRAIELAEQALTGLPADNFQARGEVMFVLGLAYVWQFDLPNAIEICTKAGALAQRAGDLHTTVLALSNGVAALFMQGELRLAAQAAQQVLTIISAQNAQQLSIAVVPLQLLADLQYEWNELSQANDNLTQALGRASQAHIPRSQVLCYAGLARLERARGNHAAGHTALQQAVALVEEHKLPARYTNEVKTLQVKWWLVQGELTPVQAWAQELGLRPDDDVTGREGTYRLLVRLLLAQGDFVAALQLLERLWQSAMTLGKVLSTVETTALKCIVLQASGQRTQAATVLVDLLRQVQPQGYIRTFVDEGEPMQRLLADARVMITDPALLTYTTHLLAAFPDTPLTYSSPQPAIPSPIQPESIQNPKSKIQNLVEPLTAREIEVLHLVAEGLSDRQIAAQLVVALGTVKRHLNNLYGKLGVQRRTQAILRAKEAGLL